MITSYLKLIEGIMNNRYFVHVTSSKNYKNILANGLIPKINGGNYSGYFESLDGVYASRIPSIINQHIFARDIQNDYLLIIIEVSGKSYVDEDVFDDILRNTFFSVLKNNDMTIADIEEGHSKEFEEELIGEFVSKLGIPSSNDYMDLVTEYVIDWINEQIGIDVETWEYVKTKMTEIFPNVIHPLHGKDYSIRIPHVIKYDGDTRIVGIVRVRHGIAKIVQGSIPQEAKPLLSLLSDINESAPPGKKAERFIRQNKAEFKNRYGRDWEKVLYSTAWKKFRKNTK